ncbi:Biotin transporter BioY [Corynebacterium capitovis DSM 44611]|uniref:biotin transporter BioY n=1 Tax=Corynebacterium capitovis TaxID=131081 RepID=UPI00038049D8|nr:biotin transporter BioY [Corynebacterium capitovis]WKD57500.1 Biotin transporter BioY [Corynebacterium capitovis DSM 44611]
MTTTARSASSRTSDVAYIAVFAALIIVLGVVSVPVGVAGIPIVLQNAAILLAALVLGPRRGFLTAALFLLIGIALPVLAGGRTVLQAAGGPSVGYLLGYLIAPLVAGAIALFAAGKSKPAQVLWFAIAGVAGLAIQYLCGSVGLMVRSDLSLGAALAAQLPFLPGDSIKVVAVVLIAAGVHSAFPRLLAVHSRRREL